MTSEPKKVLYFELAHCLARSWWTVVAGVALGLAGGLFVLEHTPAVYEASARLNLDSEKLPKEFFRDTVPGTENPELQLSLIRQAVLTPASLEAMVSAVVGEDASPEEQGALTARVRAEMQVVQPRFATYFEIRYRDNDPERAAKIVNALAEGYVEENLRFRVRGARETLETLESMADRKWQELRSLRAEVADFTSRNQVDVGADRTETAALLAAARTDLERIEASKNSLREQIEVVEVQKSQQPLIAPPTARTPRSGGAGADPVLARLEGELADLLTRYSETHPDVIAKRSEIERARGARPAQPENDAPAPGDGSAGVEAGAAQPIDHLDFRLGILRRERQKLDDEERSTRARIAEYERRLASIPGIQNRILEKERDLEILEAEYRTIRTQVEEARSSEMVEQSGRGSQFEIIQPAITPSKPVHPQPLFFLAAGAALGIVLFVGPVLVRAFLVPVVGSEARLEALSEIPILVVIPTMATPATAQRKRRLWMTNAALALISVAALAVVFGMRVVGAL